METLLNLGLANAAAATALAIVVTASCRLLSGRPAVLHCLWLLVLLKLVTPPLWSVNLPAWAPCNEVTATEEIGDEPPIPETGGEPVEVAIASPIEPEISVVEEVPAPRGWLAILPALLGGLWIGGACASLVVAGARVAKFRRLLAYAYRAPAEIQDELDVLGMRLGLSRLPLAWCIDARITPMLWAVGCRPRVIIPRGLWDRLDRDQRSMLLVHELAHVHRGDHAVRPFELLVTSLFWWLPTVWWARRALHDAEEQCCDAWVTWAFPKGARAYAESLLETIDFVHASGSPEPVLATGFGKVQHLRKRLTMIMLGTTSRRLTLRGTLGTFATAALLLPLSPSWAQKPGEADDRQITIVETAEVVADEPSEKKEEVKTEVQVVVGSPDGKTVVGGGSLDRAKKVLSERIEALVKEKDRAKEKGKAEANEAQIRALKGALEGLEKADARSRTLELKLDTPRAKETREAKEHRTIVIRKVPDDRLASPEAKAKLDKARARLDKLRAELLVKRKELAEAELELAKLSGATGEFQIRGPGVIELQAKPIRIEKRIIARPEAVISAKTLGGKDAAKLSRDDHERLVVMEKQMAELLEQVKSLKKQGQHEKSAR